MIQNIVFDMGGVLIQYVPANIVARLGLSPEDGALLFREVFNTVEWVQLDRGTISEPEALAAMTRNLPPRLHAMAAQLIEWWKLELRPVEGMEALLAELKAAGYGLYLLSNATVRQPEYFHRIPGSQYFDGRIVSGFYKVLKPQREIYEILFREFSLKPEECFFVDDSNANVEGAACVGMAGAVFDGDTTRLRQALAAAGVHVKQ